MQYAARSGKQRQLQRRVGIAGTEQPSNGWSLSNMGSAAYVLLATYGMIDMDAVQSGLCNLYKNSLSVGLLSVLTQLVCCLLAC